MTDERARRMRRMDDMIYRVSRRDFLKAGAAVGIGSAGLTSSQGKLIESLVANSGAGSLSDVKHVVMLMQENRSFDHYFGTMPGVRGYQDTTSYTSYPGGPSTNPSTVFSQSMVGTAWDGTPVNLKLASGDSFLQPFELISNPPYKDGQSTADLDNGWATIHNCWNNGAMDRFAIEGIGRNGTSAIAFKDVDGVPVPTDSKVLAGPLTMGYYRQSDSLQFYRALADAFTICDGYHCSILSQTDPNRLMWMTGSLGAHSGDAGGVVLETTSTTNVKKFGTLEWPTMPELLTAHGISWKVYEDPWGTVAFNVLPYFKNYLHPKTTEQITTAANALGPVFPASFVADIVGGTLPQVSWILPSLDNSEHPSTGPTYGEVAVYEILEMLQLNPDVWAQTVFILIYDENDGFFDHVAPPTPGPMIYSLADIPSTALINGVPYGLDGEYVMTYNPTIAGDGVPTWNGILGPLGLGVRVPALVISPFSAGGWVCPDTFDHVSTLKLIESLFLPAGTLMGSAGLHISDWRYNLVGDLTTALPALSSPDTTIPTLPVPVASDPPYALDIVPAGVQDIIGEADYSYQLSYPIPTSNTGIPALDPDSLGTRRQTP